METDGIELNSRRNGEAGANTATVVNLRAPKKLLHFSDGVMEEYSDSEDECDAAPRSSDECVDVKNLEWAPYMRFKANKMGNKMLSGIDYVGGGLASFFGLTPSDVEIAAAKKKIAIEDATDEEQSNTWNSTQSNVVISNQFNHVN